MPLLGMPPGRWTFRTIFGPRRQTLGDFYRASELLRVGGAGGGFLGRGGCCLWIVTCLEDL